MPLVAVPPPLSVNCSTVVDTGPADASVVPLLEPLTGAATRLAASDDDRAGSAKAAPRAERRPKYLAQTTHDKVKQWSRSTTNRG